MSDSDTDLLDEPRRDDEETPADDTSVTLREVAGSTLQRDDQEKPADDTPQYPVLSVPADGLPALTDTWPALAKTQAALARGTGPIAFDTERAATYRYSNRAYLIQLRSPETLTCLIDPIAFQNGRELADLSAFGTAAREREWILHAASQDLPCMCEVGLRPTRLFDTELAGRLLGLRRVSLGTMIEHYFGLSLLKEHSVADWSQRPLPESWTAYAALDVELLIELRDKLATELASVGKDEWAAQEFAYIVERHLEPPEERPDRFRRLTGSNQIRTRLGLAILRELWTTRDQIAEDLDRWPGRIVPDHALTAIALLANNGKAPSAGDVRSLAEFRAQRSRVFLRDWQDAVARAATLNEKQMPPMRAPRIGPPDPRNWEKTNPQAYARLLAAKPRVVSLAEDLVLPGENLLSPATLRALCWDAPAQLDSKTIEFALSGLGARKWQCELVAPVLAHAFAAL
ncbi:MAG: HRDC domain-containing protein [Propionibacteriaceae bacterium]|jgi:ribonuclease D|nr:HRDC domain-containing protein [Propionibacteriaceae bacterium]